MGLNRPRGCGGIGRHARLRGVWLRPCEFKSRHPHFLPKTRSVPLDVPIHGFNALCGVRVQRTRRTEYLGSSAGGTAPQAIAAQAQSKAFASQSEAGAGAMP